MSHQRPIRPTPYGVQSANAGLIGQNRNMSPPALSFHPSSPLPNHIATQSALARPVSSFLGPVPSTTHGFMLAEPRNIQHGQPVSYTDPQEQVQQLLAQRQGGNQELQMMYQPVPYHQSPHAMLSKMERPYYDHFHHQQQYSSPPSPQYPGNGPQFRAERPRHTHYGESYANSAHDSSSPRSSRGGHKYGPISAKDQCKVLAGNAGQSANPGEHEYARFDCDDSVTLLLGNIDTNEFRMFLEGSHKPGPTERNFRPAHTWS